MYLLYLDGSGSVKNPTERHFVLADDCRCPGCLSRALRSESAPRVTSEVPP